MVGKLRSEEQIKLRMFMLIRKISPTTSIESENFFSNRELNALLSIADGTAWRNVFHLNSSLPC